MYFPLVLLAFFALTLTVGANKIDQQYKHLVRKILDEGEPRNDRTGTGTIALFAPSPLVFDVSHEAFPLLTTKKVTFRLIAEELFFFLSGSSNVGELQKRNVRIWDQNAAVNIEGRAGFYSQAWRYFGANEFSHDKQEMKKQAHVDQIADAINKIQHDPTSRRIFISSWDALNIKMNPTVLPPCHISMQYFVRNDGTLDMQVYQRSADVALGYDFKIDLWSHEAHLHCMLPFNIGSYSLLLLLMAYVTDRTPGKITYVLGDSHLYANILEPIMRQLERKPFPLPKIRFKTNIQRGSGLEGLLKFTVDDLELVEYNSHPPIKMVMSA